jgi:DNA-directed RNA polymerase specialized sigma24 family protein
MTDNCHDAIAQIKEALRAAETDAPTCRWLDALRYDTRRCVELIYRDECSVGIAAARLGLSARTVKRRLRGARILWRQMRVGARRADGEG